MYTQVVMRKCYLENSNSLLQHSLNINSQTELYLPQEYCGKIYTATIIL